MKRQFTTLAISSSPPPFPSPLCKDKQFSRNCECSHNLPRLNAIHRPPPSTTNNPDTGNQQKWIQRPLPQILVQKTNQNYFTGGNFHLSELSRRKWKFIVTLRREHCNYPPSQRWQSLHGIADKTKLQGRAKNLGCSFFSWLINEPPASNRWGVAFQAPVRPTNPNACFDYHIAPW